MLVKASYFPNWKVSGAKGPFRVTPNEMVVIPTRTHVSLYYGTTPVDDLGWFVTLLGLAALVWLWRRPPVRYPTPRALPVTPVADDAGDEVYSTALERQLAGVNGGGTLDIEHYFD